MTAKTHTPATSLGLAIVSALGVGALSATDLERIEAAVPAGAAAGSRYADFLMGELDRERRAA